MIVLVRILAGIAWSAVFLALLLVAVKNAEPVTLRFYFGHSWEVPLVLVALASFAAGALFGVLACLPALVRQRRGIAGLQQELRLRGAAPQPPVPPIVPDAPSSS